MVNEAIKINLEESEYKLVRYPLSEMKGSHLPLYLQQLCGDSE